MACISQCTRCGMQGHKATSCELPFHRPICSKCKRLGHEHSACPITFFAAWKNLWAKTRFAPVDDEQVTATACMCCGREDHVDAKCPFKDAIVESEKLASRVLDHNARACDDAIIQERVLDYLVLAAWNRADFNAEGMEPDAYDAEFDRNHTPLQRSSRLRASPVLIADGVFGFPRLRPRRLRKPAERSWSMIDAPVPPGPHACNGACESHPGNFGFPVSTGPGTVHFMITLISGAHLGDCSVEVSHTVAELKRGIEKTLAPGCSVDHLLFESESLVDDRTLAQINLTDGSAIIATLRTMISDTFCSFEVDYSDYEDEEECGTWCRSITFQPDGSGYLHDKYCTLQGPCSCDPSSLTFKYATGPENEDFDCKWKQLDFSRLEAANGCVTHSKRSRSGKRNASAKICSGVMVQHGLATEVVIPGLMPPADSMFVHKSKGFWDIESAALDMQATSELKMQRAWDTQRAFQFQKDEEIRMLQERTYDLLDKKLCTKMVKRRRLRCRKPWRSAREVVCA